MENALVDDKAAEGNPVTDGGVSTQSWSPPRITGHVPGLCSTLPSTPLQTEVIGTKKQMLLIFRNLGGGGIQT